MLDVALVTLGDPHTLTGGYLFHLRMAEAAPHHGARLRFCSLPRRRPLAAAPRLLADARRAQVVVVDSIAAAYLAPWAASVREAALVGSLHQPPGGIDHPPWRERIQRRADLAVWRRCRLLVAASDHLAQQLVAAGLPEDRVRVVPPGWDSPTPPAAPLRLRRGGEVVVLTVGNWVPRKGLLEAVQAVSRLPPGSVTLHMVGDDGVDPRYRRTVLRAIREGGLSEQVVIHGPLPREAVDAMYRAADVFLLPSRREPYGTVWAEAMAQGLPVVGWRGENLPHLAPQGEVVMVPTGEVAKLAEELSLLVERPELRRRIGAAARRRAAAFPTWEESARRFFAAVAEGAQRVAR